MATTPERMERIPIAVSAEREARGEKAIWIPLAIGR
jgi:hypothetical protein